MRREQLEVLAREPLALARHDERRDPLRAARGGAGEDAVDVGFGRVRDPDLRAGQAEAAAVALGTQSEVRRVRPRLGLAEREGGDGLAAREPRDPLLAQRRLPAAEDRVAAEALQRERRLGLGAAVRETLAELAELDRGAGEDQLEQAVLAEGPHERAVQPSRLSLRGDAERTPRARGGGRVRGRQPSRTATPISSTRASGSSRAETPIKRHRRIAPAEVPAPDLPQLARRRAVLLDLRRVDDERDEPIRLAPGGAERGDELPGGRVELLDERGALAGLAAEVHRAARDDGVREADRLGQLRRVDDHRPRHAGSLPSDQAA